MGSGVTPVIWCCRSHSAPPPPQQHLPSMVLGKGHPTMVLQPHFAPVPVPPPPRLSPALREPRLPAGSWTVFLCRNSCCSVSDVCRPLWPKALQAVLLRNHNKKKNVTLKIIQALDYELLRGRKTQPNNKKTPTKPKTPQYPTSLCLNSFPGSFQGKKSVYLFPLPGCWVAFRHDPNSTEVNGKFSRSLNRAPNAGW